MRFNNWENATEENWYCSVDNFKAWITKYPIHPKDWNGHQWIGGYAVTVSVETATGLEFSVKKKHRPLSEPSTYVQSLEAAKELAETYANLLAKHG